MAELSFSKRILITGGRSRLAGVIHPHLQAKGADLTTFSRVAGSGHEALESLFAGDTLSGADTLLHLAWSTVPMSSEQRPGSESAEDLPFLTKLLDAIVAAPRRPHFIFFSSGGAIYGNAVNGRPNRETDVCAPVGRYGIAKLAAEQVIANYAERHGLEHTILRISNPYGFAVPSHQPQGIVPFLLRSARTGATFSLWGDGTARKDFLHYTDFISALDEIIRVKPRGVFNVSHGESHTVNEVIQCVEATIGKKINLRHGPANAWDVHDSLLDNAKLRATVQWKPTVGLAEGIPLAAAHIT